MLPLCWTLIVLLSPHYMAPFLLLFHCLQRVYMPFNRFFHEIKYQNNQFYIYKWFLKDLINCWSLDWTIMVIFFSECSEIYYNNMIWICSIIGNCIWSLIQGSVFDPRNCIWSLIRALILQQNSSHLIASSEDNEL